MKYGKEILVGIAAGLLIAGGLYWDQTRVENAANIEAAQMQTHALSRLAQSAKRRTGAYPAELTTQPDPWGSRYFMIENRVCSRGADGKPATTDDICAP